MVGRLLADFLRQLPGILTTMELKRQDTLLITSVVQHKHRVSLQQRQVFLHKLLVYLQQHLDLVMLKVLRLRDFLLQLLVVLVLNIYPMR